MYTLYILLCSDGTLYTGITNNLEKRLKEHNSGTGAKYTKGRSPVKIVYTESCANRSDALKREIEIKKMNKISKNNLISTNL